MLPRLSITQFFEHSGKLSQIVELKGVSRVRMWYAGMFSLFLTDACRIALILVHQMSMMASEDGVIVVHGRRERLG
jgi:hypothetical protein